MTTESIGQAHGLFQIHFAARGIESHRAVQRLARDIDLVAVLLLGDHRQADAAVGDRVAQRDIAELEAGRFDREAQALLQGLDVADFSDGGDFFGVLFGSGRVLVLPHYRHVHVNHGLYRNFGPDGRGCEQWHRAD